MNCQPLLNGRRLPFYGGWGGIRTPGTVARTPHFECGAFNHSATHPKRVAHVVVGRGGSIAEGARQGKERAYSPVSALIAKDGRSP